MSKYFLAATLLSFSALHSFGTHSGCDVRDASEQTPAPRTADVYLSAPSCSFEIGASALFLQPTGSDLHYAAEAFPIPVPSPSWKIYGIDTDYHAAFDVSLKGIFHSTHSSLMLNWTHFHSSDSASTEVPTADMIGPFFEIGPDATPFSKAYGSAHFEFDVANLDYGIFLHLGDRLQSNLFSGLSFTRIEQTLTANYSNDSGSITRTIKTPSTFLGAGPQVGMDLTYRLAKGFNLTGLAQASLLIGTQKNHTAYTTFAPELPGLGVTPPNQQKTTVDSGTQVVPAFKGKMGLSYVYNYGRKNMFKVEAGYQAELYMNAIQSVDLASEVDTPPVTPATVGVYARTFKKDISNFALAGPYLTIEFGF